MASSYTTNINLEKPAPGEQSGDWGATLNSNFDTIDTKLAIKDEDNMASDSASHLATQQSIKAYVDSQVNTEETIEDFVGGMVTGNTETGIAVTYEDGDGTLDFVVSDTTVAGDSGSTGMTPGDTLTIAGGTNVTTAMSGDTLTITSTNTQLSQENVEDYVGGMVTGNTETGISVTYEDGDGTLDFVVSDTTVAGDSGSTAMTPGDTLTIAGGTNITTAMSGDTLTITGATSSNFIYNGDMQVCQRATSASSLGNGNTGYHVQDRWQYGESGAPNAVVTMSQSTTTPDGFNSSLKLDCTTASGTVDAADVVYIAQIFEGQDLQSWNKGDAQAKAVTLSFWVNTTKTGTYIVSLHDNDNNRHISKAYTVSSTNTWEYKTLTFAGDTSTGDPFDNDNATSLYVQFVLVAGSNYTDGTLATSWADWNDGNSYVGQVDALDSTSNNFHMTGVQLELGSVATEFQYEKPNENLLRCQRYYAKRAASNAVLYGSSVTGSGLNYTHWQFHVPMRSAPTMTGEGGGSSGNTQQQISVDSGGSYASAGIFATWGNGSTADAELS
jgi:hypothetical protein